MRKMLAVLVLATLPMSSIAAPESYTIDPLHTFSNFTIDHLGFSTMHGRFGKITGKLTIDREKGTGTVEVVIDATSVNTGYEKRDDHIRSPDFLNVMEFPTITYKSTKVVINANKSAVVDGNLTLAGVNKPVRLTVKRMNCAINPMDPTQKQFVCGFDAETKIKRSDFGVKFALPLVGDDMPISFEVEALRDTK